MTRLGLAILLTGCAAYARSEGALPPGYGVSDNLAITACGSLEDFRARVEGYNEMYQAAYDRGEPIPLGGLVPQIGQTDCDVLAMLGAPDDMAVVAGVGDPSTSWTYLTGDGVTRKAHLVTFGFRDGALVVTSIVW